MRFFLFLCAAIGVSGCASIPYESVPVLEDGGFSSLTVRETVLPKSVDVKISNERRFRNSNEIGEKVSKIILRSFEKGGVKVSADSPNKFVFYLRECPKSPNKEECLLIESDYKDAQTTYHFDDMCSKNKLGSSQNVFQACLLKQFKTINLSFSGGR